MSILSVDNISPIGSGTSVTINNAATLVLNNVSVAGVSTFTGNIDANGALDVNGTSTITGVCYPQNGIRVPDDIYSYFGTGNDLSIRHDAAGGNHSYIFHHGTGAFKLASDTQMILGETGPRNYIQMNPNSDVKLYYNNNEKFATTNTGAVVTGICTATTFEATTFSKTPTNTPAFHAFRNGNFSPSFPNSTWTKITLLTTETLDTDNAYDNSSSGTTANRFTVPSGKGGYYQVAAALNFYADSNDLKSALVAIYKNGSKTMSAYGFISNYTSGVRHFQCDIAGILNLSASDYLEVYAYFTTNGGVNNYISNDASGLRGNYFSAFKLII